MRENFNGAKRVKTHAFCRRNFHTCVNIFYTPCVNFPHRRVNIFFTPCVKFIRHRVTMFFTHARILCRRHVNNIFHARVDSTHGRVNIFNNCFHSTCHRGFDATCGCVGAPVPGQARPWPGPGLARPMWLGPLSGLTS